LYISASTIVSSTLETMSATEAEFQAAAERAKNLSAKPSDAILLQLYGLYKQATTGDIDIPQPWSIQIEAKAKWTAWNAHKGESRESARTAYVALVQSLVTQEQKE